MSIDTNTNTNTGAEQVVANIPAVVPYTVHVVQATQKIVDYFLERNHGNRYISPDRVAAIARDIAAGNWRNNGSTIVVDADNNLKDGQHRLCAIRAAGYPAGISLILVKLSTRGAEAERDFRTMNTGRVGASAQMFTNTGVKNPREVTAICRGIVQRTVKLNAAGGETERKKASSVTNAEIAACYSRFREVVDFWATRHANTVLNYPSCALAAFAALEISFPADSPNIRAIAQDIGNSENLTKGSAPHRLFSYLMAIRKLHMSWQLQDEVFDTVINAMVMAIADNCANERKPIRSIQQDPKRIEKIVCWVLRNVVSESKKAA